MKAIRYVCCVLVLVCLMNAVHTDNSRSKIDQQLFDEFATDESLKSKRPFCNAFTGCGKKRNFQENPTNSQDMEGNDNIRLPLSVYKVLLRAASQNIRNTIDRESNEYELSGIPRVYLSGKMPLRKRFDVPSASFEWFHLFSLNAHQRCTSRYFVTIGLRIFMKIKQSFTIYIFAVKKTTAVRKSSTLSRKFSTFSIFRTFYSISL